MALNTCQTRPNGIKIPFFCKKLQDVQTPIASGDWGFAPRTPFEIHFSYTSLLDTSSVFNIFKFGFKPSPFSKILVKCQTRPWLLIFHFTMTLYHKKFLLKISGDVIACDLGFAPPIQNPGYTYALEIFALSWKEPAVGVHVRAGGPSPLNSNSIICSMSFSPRGKLFSKNIS